MAQEPLADYRARVAAGELKDDAAQRLAVEKLQLLHARLKDYNRQKPKRVGLGLFGWGREKITQSAIPGLYLYGGVGRGKSMLMDLFFDSAPVAAKRRVHFHAFMQEIHDGIHKARSKGVSDPVEPVAEAVAESATLLCFDEMQITDITDAMLVGRLFEKLFEKGVVIVTTSNRHPSELYKDGLNRQLFLPFIALISEKLEVYHLASETDHRRDRQKDRPSYYVPIGAKSAAALDEIWEALCTEWPKPLDIEVQGRTLHIPHFSAGAARATFADLCAKPLGARDYLALVARIHTLVLDNIPRLSQANNNEAKRFVTLIDTLYEAHTRLYCSADAVPEALYQEGAGAFEFERTVSRLQEMQSADWLAEA